MIFTITAVTVLVFSLFFTKKFKSDEGALSKSFVKTFLITMLFSLVLAISSVPFKYIESVGMFNVSYSVGGYIKAFAFALIGCAIYSLFFFLNKKLREESKKRSAIVNVLLVISCIIYAVGICFYYTTEFILKEWSGVDVMQIIVNSMSPTAGTELGIYIAGFSYVFCAFSLIALFAIFAFSKYDYVFRLKNATLRINQLIKAVFLFFMSVIVCFYSLMYSSNMLSFQDIYKIYFEKSTFIEENYVNPKGADIRFTAGKRNLIYIYLESMENTYLSKDLGGAMDKNLMPELTELSYEGITFSDNEGKFGGPVQISGTSWSLASMINQDFGLPLKAPKSANTYSTAGAFMPGAYGIGDILGTEGYEQTVMIGAKAVFGGLNYLYENHGNNTVFDYDYAIENGYIPKDYKVFWGFEDDKLYEFAKGEISRLYQTGKPFCFTMETADTHMPYGYLPPDAPQPYDDPYANAISNSTADTVEFVKWIQSQPFYENTTVVLIGDHQSMAVEFFAKIDESYKRSQYNLILNPADNVKNTDKSRFVNRTYTNLDMFPTVLAAMGCEFNGNRLGLGTNLFSDEKTVVEEYGVQYVSDEFIKGSDFYSQKILCEE